MSNMNKVSEQLMDLPTCSIVISGSFDLTACSENVDYSKEIRGGNTGISWSFQLTAGIDKADQLS
jgi:hypothetical protein